MSQAWRLILSGSISAVPIFTAAYFIGYTIDLWLVLFMFIVCFSNKITDRITGVE